MLKFTCLTVGLLYYNLETLLAHFLLQKAETVLGRAAINFMSAEKARLTNRIIVDLFLRLSIFTD